MKQIAILVIIALVGGFVLTEKSKAANSDNYSPAFKAALDAFEQEVAKAQRDINDDGKLRDQITSLNQKIRELEKQASTDSKKSHTIFGNARREDGESRRHAEDRVAQMELDYRKEIDSRKDELDRVNKDLNAKLKDIYKNKVSAENMKAQLAQLDASVRAARITDTIKDLKGDLLSNEVKLERVERIYDQGLIGSYIQAKFERFANSNAICDSVSRCDGAKRKSGMGSKVDLNKEIFAPEGMNDGMSGGYSSGASGSH